MGKKILEFIEQEEGKTFVWQVVDLDNCPRIHGKTKSLVKGKTGEW